VLIVHRVRGERPEGGRRGFRPRVRELLVDAVRPNAVRSIAPARRLDSV
jgi:hypothetical protein